jgi:predicted transposase/invertase (TIGR01784 family)
MPIARLDNEVFLKKAFTDPIVFKAFVKDIIGVDVEPDKIETEKSFIPKVGNIAFKYDIFAEDSRNRLIIEIQRVDYDRQATLHNFDRFLHYHLQAITEQQRTSSDYTVDRTVFTIVVITGKYKIHQKTGEIVEDEVLLSSLNPRNLKGQETNIFGHLMYFLNPNYKDLNTPQNYRDWLDLIYESMHNAESPNVNLANEGIKRATEIVQYENITPEEWESAKIEVSRRKVLVREREEGKTEGKLEGILEGKLEIARLMKIEGEDIEKIIKFTGLTREEINQL